MAKVLLIAEHDGTSLNPSTAKCVACAAEISGAEIEVAVFAESAGAIAAQAASLDSVSRVLSNEATANRGALAAVLAPQIVAMADSYDYIFGPSTTFGKDLMPRVAALLGVNQISDIMSVEGERVFKRPIYAGSAVVTVEAPAGVPVVATIRTASFRAVGAGNSAPVDAVDVSADIPDHTRFIASETGKSDRPDLQSASRVVAGGRALGSEENFDLIYKLADKLEAGVGASRAAVDAGYVPNEMQVGQTGRIIAPDLYIAIGISGAIQHLTGIKDAGTIVAINKDEEAPIFEVADIGLVGDLFNVVPELTEALD
ncbi:MAG: FAD-binding protein [Gammaproteobacteria bacterium]|jgi:electron transfer flavoprotein alpha subunit|nr:FAD-binding protein [Gammaproteobacteria bacterium]MDH3757401.1 FAD-binding protein [Gammaproteobacteria bacterium]MDH3847769.1 FAD-binding protein [Gammaproteobacteria bacterium]MDH3863395.1 FAD-binding protein [Gammaproteobacteria bacterium]MDH3905742.1 FAD-binding protein [Gammaproteobacteria bacterium]